MPKVKKTAPPDAEPTSTAAGIPQSPAQHAEPTPAPNPITYNLSSFDAAGVLPTENFNLTANQFKELKRYLLAKVSESSSQSEPAAASSFLIACLEFDADADDESRQLLFDVFKRWQTQRYPFAMVMAELALDFLGVDTIGLDDLDNLHFRELLNLFGDAVSGYGYYGLREQIIERLLREGNSKMEFDAMLGIVAQEFEQKHADIGTARQALKDYPSELGGVIAEAMEASPKFREQIVDALGKIGRHAQKES